MAGEENAFFIKGQIRKAIIAGALLLTVTVLYSFIETFHELGCTGVNDRGGYILEERRLEHEEREGRVFLRNAAASTNLFSDARGQRSLRLLPVLKADDVKSHLNKLVEASVAATDQQVARYDNGYPMTGRVRPVEEAFPKILKEAGGRVDIMHYHIGTTNNMTCTWEVAEEYYRQIMRDPSSINFITILREPRQHLLSYYYYFVGNKIGHKSIAAFFSDPDAQREFTPLMNNTLAGEFGVKDAEDLHHFSSAVLPRIKLVMLADRFDEGLMLLRILMGWHMIDMTYVSLNKNPSGTKVTLFPIPEEQPMDTTRVRKRPNFDDLPKKVQDRIDELTQLDRAVYEVGKIEFEKSLAPLAQSVKEDMIKFRKLQTAVEKYLQATSPSPANDLYKYEDFFHVFPEASPF